MRLSLFLVLIACQCWLIVQTEGFATPMPQGPLNSVAADTNFGSYYYREDTKNYPVDVPRRRNNGRGQIMQSPQLPPPGSLGYPQQQSKAHGMQHQRRDRNYENMNSENLNNWYEDSWSSREPTEQRRRRNGMPIQGGSRRTFHSDYYAQNNQYYEDGSQMSLVQMQSDTGRPMNAEYELWEGPDNTPTRMNVYSEDGLLRPFQAGVRNNRPNGRGYVQSVRNAGPMEFPIAAGVNSNPYYRAGNSGMVSSVASSSTAPRTTIQGGALRTWSFDHTVGSARVTLTTDGLPVYALIEHWGVDGHVKQIAEIYNEDGARRPFWATIQMPGGSGDTIAIRNTGPLEYPVTASVEPQYGYY